MECIITKLQLYYLCLFSGEICIYWYCVRCLNDCFVLLLFFQCNAALQAKHLVIHRYFTIKWQISGKIRLLRSVCGEQWGRAAIIIHWLRCLWQNMNYQKKKNEKQRTTIFRIKNWWFLIQFYCLCRYYWRADETYTSHWYVSQLAFNKDLF